MSVLSVTVPEEPEALPEDEELGRTKKRSSRHMSNNAQNDRSAKARIQKGLRHFSLKVCEKVEQLKNTTYNKVHLLSFLRFVFWAHPVAPLPGGR